MKLQHIVLAGLTVLVGISCTKLDDIYDEIDANFDGFITKDARYTLTSSDYKTISANAKKEAMTGDEIVAAENILAGDTALTDGYNETQIPAIVASKTDFQGFGRTSLVAVTYKYRDTVTAVTRDTTQSYFKKSKNSWMLLPDAGYAYDFEDGLDYDPVALNGWSQTADGGVADRNFVYRSFGGNRYAQITAYSSTGVLEDKVDMWLVSPVLNLNEVYVAKNLRFSTANAYPNGATLTVYILDNADPTQASLKEELADVKIAGSSDNNYAFVKSGVIDLSAYSGNVYVAFRYLAEPGQTTTYQVDNFEFDFLEVE